MNLCLFSLYLMYHTIILYYIYHYNKQSWPLKNTEWFVQIISSKQGATFCGKKSNSIGSKTNKIQFTFSFWMKVKGTFGPLSQWSPTLGLQMFLDFNSQKSWPAEVVVNASGSCSPRTSGGPRLRTTVLEIYSKIPAILFHYPSLLPPLYSTIMRSHLPHWEVITSLAT